MCPVILKTAYQQSASLLTALFAVPTLWDFLAPTSIAELSTLHLNHLTYFCKSSCNLPNLNLSTFSFLLHLPILFSSLFPTTALTPTNFCQTKRTYVFRKFSVRTDSESLSLLSNFLRREDVLI